MGVKEDGGPAFPPNAGWRDNDPKFHGMTLRDYFAAKAMQAWMIGWATDSDPRTDLRKEIMAEVAYAAADAMLKERDK